MSVASAPKPRVVFLCVHNAGRSQMAAGWLRHQRAAALRTVTPPRSPDLNNNVPVHVIQALLGHATLDTIMVYAKLYPTTLIEEYRKAVRGLYNAFHGDDSLRIRSEKL